MSRRTLLLAIVFGLCALAAWDLLLRPLTEPPTQGVQPPNAGIGTGGWVVIAAIAGAVFTSLGAFLNDFYARQREDRLAEREAEIQRQQWAREDRTQREEKEEADLIRVREQRARSYKAFVAATTFPAPFGEDLQGDFDQDLSERYTDVLLYCSDWVAQNAEDLYNAAREALLDPDAYEVDPVRQRLKERRTEFWDSVREEAREDYSHS